MRLTIGIFELRSGLGRVKLAEEVGATLRPHNPDPRKKAPPAQRNSTRDKDTEGQFFIVLPGNRAYVSALPFAAGRGLS